jgi:hypothetical protein
LHQPPKVHKLESRKKLDAAKESYVFQKGQGQRQKLFISNKKDVGVKSRRTIMRRLEELFYLKQEQLKNTLEECSKLSITCDLWTSRNQLSFFGSTGHWFDRDYCYHERLISFKYVEGDHDGENLCDEMINVLERLAIIDNTTMMAEMENVFKV